MWWESVNPKRATTFLLSQCSLILSSLFSDTIRNVGRACGAIQKDQSLSIKVCDRPSCTVSRTILRMVTPCPMTRKTLPSPFQLKNQTIWTYDMGKWALEQFSANPLTSPNLSKFSLFYRVIGRVVIWRLGPGSCLIHLPVPTTVRADRARSGIRHARRFLW